MSVTYGKTETLQKLGIGTDKWLMRLHHAGLLPYELEGTAYRYDAAYIDGLAAKLQLGVRHGSTMYDYNLVVLFQLSQQYAKLQSDSSRRARNERAAIKRQCAALVEAGEIKTLDQLHHALRNVYRRDTIRTLAKRGKIPHVRIGMGCFVSTRYYNHLVWLFAKCKRVLEVALELGVSDEVLLRLVRSEGLRIYRGPDGVMRLNWQVVYAVRRILDARNDRRTVSPQEAATRLGLSLQTVRRQIGKGRVREALPSQKANKRIPVREVERLEVTLTTINMGFEWLDKQHKRGVRPQTMSFAQTRRRLGVHDYTLTRWSRDNLVPYYVRPWGRDIRDYVAAYIDGLVRFAAGGEVTMVLARTYLAYCIEAGRVI